MSGLLNVLYYSLGSLFLGVFITLIGIVLMFLLIKGWWKDSRFTPVSFITGVLLFFFLAYQSILICGAVTIKSYSDDLKQYTNELVRDLPSGQPLSRQDSQDILEKWSEEYPLVGYYANSADFQGHTTSDIAQVMVDVLNTFMNWFIVRRVGWSIFFIVAGAFIVIRSMRRNGSQPASRTASSGAATVTRGSRRRTGGTERTRRVHRRVR